jgi:hypothetical protein
MTFTRGRHLLRMNFGVFGPALSADDAPAYRWAGAVRKGNTVRADLPMFADGAGHIGQIAYDEASTSLTADGEEIFASDRPVTPADTLVLPEDERAYRLSTEVSRPSAPSPLSTYVAAQWTFRSAHVPEGREARLPLSVVRFSPRLAPDGTAAAGSRSEVPYTIQGAAASDGVRALRFEVSYDGAGTWRPVTDAGGRLVLDHPRGSGSVSLRVRLTDARHNTLEQTIERAYLLR